MQVTCCDICKEKMEKEPSLMIKSTERDFYPSRILLKGSSKTNKLQDGQLGMDICEKCVSKVLLVLNALGAGIEVLRESEEEMRHLQ